MGFDDFCGGSDIFVSIAFIFLQVYEILVYIAKVSSGGSSEPAHNCNLATTFTARTHKVDACNTMYINHTDHERIF